MKVSQMALEIAKIEGGKVPLSIAQIKEVLRCLGDIYCQLEDEGQQEFILSQSASYGRRHKKKAKKK